MSSSSLVYQRSHDSVKPGSDINSCGRLSYLCLLTVIHLVKWKQPEVKLNDAIVTTFWGINKATLNLCPGKRWSAVLTCRGLICGAAATSVFLCWFCTPADVCRMYLPVDTSQRLQTGGWLWKLFVTEYTRSTRTWTQHWTCLVALTGCVITGVVMVSQLLSLIFNLWNTRVTNNTNVGCVSLAYWHT